MVNLNDSARRDALKLAMRLAEIREEDVEDMQECITDLKTAGLDDNAARVVASAYREKTLPSALLQEGFDKKTVTAFLGSEGHHPMTADFANDIDADKNDTIPSRGGFIHGDNDGDEDDQFAPGEGSDDNMGDGDFSSSSENILPMKDDENTDDDGTDDSGEADDNIATLQIEVPADKVDAVTEAIEKALSGLLGNGDETADGPDLDTLGADDDSSDAPADLQADDAGENADADFGSDDLSGDSDDNTDQGSSPFGKSAKTNNVSRKVQTMTNDARKKREAILAQVAGSTRTASGSEESKPRDIGLGKDTSNGGKPFQYAAGVQYENEGEFGTMTLDGSEGNSLRDQNPKFNTQDIPTLNGGNLGLKKEFKPVTKEGGSGDSDFYKVDFDMLTVVPSADFETPNFDVPTQQGTKSRKNTVTSNINSSEDAEEALYQTLVAAGVNPDDIANMTYADGVELYRTITSSNIDNLAKFAEDVNVTIEADADEDKGEKSHLDKKTNGDGFDRTPHESDTSDRDAATLVEVLEREAAVYRSRLKTAYGVSVKLCLAGILEADELEGNVDLWLNDGLTVKAMLASGAQMLRISQTSEQRVATAQAERNLRTASAQGVSTIPGFSGANTNVSSDLQQALKSIFTTVRIDE